MPARRSGFTLVELLIALVITSILLVGIFGVVQSQQAAYYKGHLQRAAQGNARSALEYVEERVATAGYGMDASLAFDFDRYVAAPCPLDTCDRDSVNENDELVFYARNPRYWVPPTATAEPRGNAWRIVALDSGKVTVNARPGDSFVAGRILQAICKGATRYAYFTVGATAPVPADATGTTPLEITLLGSVAGDPFRRQDAALPVVDGCFSGGEARLFLIDRFRFHVRPMAAGKGTQPYLVLDTGLDANGDGADDADDEIVVAEGIESFQVGYVMTEPTLAARGTVPGTAIAFTQGASGATSGDGMTTLEYPGTVDSSQSEYKSTSWYRYAVGPPPAAERLTDHQANIRAVRIAIVARGPDPDPNAGPSNITLPILNQNALPDWIDTSVPYARTRVETTVLVRNMVSRGMNDF